MFDHFKSLYELFFIRIERILKKQQFFPKYLSDLSSISQNLKTHSSFPIHDTEKTSIWSPPPKKKHQILESFFITIKKPSLKKSISNIAVAFWNSFNIFLVDSSSYLQWCLFFFTVTFTPTFSLSFTLYNCIRLVIVFVISVMPQPTKMAPSGEKYGTFTNSFHLHIKWLPQKLDLISYKLAEPI